MKQTIDQKGLRKLKGRRIKLRDLNPLEFVHVAFINELDIFGTIMHRANEPVDGFLRWTENNAVIDVRQKNHIGL